MEANSKSFEKTWQYRRNKVSFFMRSSLNSPEKKLKLFSNEFAIHIWHRSSGACFCYVHKMWSTAVCHVKVAWPYLYFFHWTENHDVWFFLNLLSVFEIIKPYEKNMHTAQINRFWIEVNMRTYLLNFYQTLTFSKTNEMFSCYEQ